MNASSHPADQVTKRLVLNFPGFEKTDSEEQLGRLKYSADNTGRIWGFSVEQVALQHEEGTHFTIANHSTNGPNWAVETRVVQYRWNDIVHKYEHAPFPGGFLRDSRKFLGFFTDGTVGKYFSTSKRYWGFTIFPVVFILIACIASFFVWWTLLAAIGVTGWLFAFAVTVLTLIATLTFCKWPGERFYILMTIADWGFARDMINRTNPEIEARFAEFGKTTAAEIAASDHDEIIIVGHSFGAVWAAEALALALAQDPDLLQGRQVTFLALGSSISKIALSPDADWMRQAVQTCVNEKNLFWHEIQTKDDFIAFYKSDPFEVLNVKPRSLFLLDRIRFSKGIEKKRYRQIRKSMFRTHRQYILHYDKRVPFDTMLRLFGPFPAKALALDPDLSTRLDGDGVLLEKAEQSGAD